MNTITIDRVTVEQALEALEKYRKMMFVEAGCRFGEGDAAITALRAALAQQAEPVEPVAWSGYDLDGMVEAFSRVIEAHYQRANPFQNPIDMDAQMALRVLRGFIPAMKAYTAPPQRKPLTEEEIEACRQQGYAHAGFSAPFDFGKAARAVERAHGIKE